MNIQASLSWSRGWRAGRWESQPTVRAPFGGNEVRFRVSGTRKVEVTLATEPYVWVHVFQDGRHVQAIAPESYPARVALPVEAKGGCEVRLLRTSVSSGPFHVDAHLLEVAIDPGGLIAPPHIPVSSRVFCTFGDSISGNGCIGPDQPFDPYDVGYGWRLVERFGWQYFNAARDGSGLCRRLFDNPLAIDRVQETVIAARPAYLLLFYGTNDLSAEVDPRGEFAPALDTLVNTLRAGLPECRIAAAALLWRRDVQEERIQEYNRVILEVCEQNRIPSVDPILWLKPDDFKDGLHPNASGHRKMADRLTVFLEHTFAELREERPEACP